MQHLLALPCLQLWRALCFVYVDDVRPLGFFPNPFKHATPLLSFLVQWSSYTSALAGDALCCYYSYEE